MRRPTFNLAVGTAGIVTCAVIVALGVAAESLVGVPFGLPDPPIVAVLGVILYGIMANVCYTAGWISELVIRRAWPAEAEAFATLSFSLGLVFSVILTVIPVIVIGPSVIVGIGLKLAGVGGNE